MQRASPRERVLPFTIPPSSNHPHRGENSTSRVALGTNFRATFRINAPHPRPARTPHCPEGRVPWLSAGGGRLVQEGCAKSCTQGNARRQIFPPAGRRRSECSLKNRREQAKRQHQKNRKNGPTQTGNGNKFASEMKAGKQDHRKEKMEKTLRP